MEPACLIRHRRASQGLSTPCCCALVGIPAWYTLLVSESSPASLLCAAFALLAALPPQTPALLSLMAFSWPWSSSAWKCLDRSIPQEGWEGRCSLWGSADPSAPWESPQRPNHRGLLQLPLQAAEKKAHLGFSTFNSLPMLFLTAQTSVAQSCRLASHHSCTQTQSPGFQRKACTADQYQIIAELPALRLHTHRPEQESSFSKRRSNAEQIGIVQTEKY